jgi:hypothetical protein
MDCNQIPTGCDWEDLSPDQLLAYRIHLKSCGHCKSRVISEAPEQLLFDLEDPHLPEDFWLGFWDSLEKKLSPAEEQNPPLIFPVVRWAAVFVFVLLLSFYSRTLREPESDGIKTVISKQPAEPSQYPLIEEVQNPNARYYIFQPEGNENIVMMFDPDMEL